MKYTNADIYYKVQNEGLDYAITCHINPDDIDNETMRELWVQAKDALEHIQILLNQEEDKMLDEHAEYSQNP